MTSLPRELAVLMQTKLTLVVAEESGHDPIKATGLVLAHLPQIAKRVVEDEAQIRTLRAVTRQHEDPWAHLKRLAARKKQTATSLYEAERLSERELAENPLVKRPS